MTRIPAKLLPHSITVQRYLGRGGYGDVFSDPDTISRANVEDKSTLVRDSKGVEVLSSATVYLEIPDDPIEVGSKVTRWKGTSYEITSRVISVSLFQHPRGLSHMVLSVE